MWHEQLSPTPSNEFPNLWILYSCSSDENLQERKRGLVIAERQEKEMQRVVENEQRMAELHKKIRRVEEVRVCFFARTRNIQCSYRFYSSAPVS